MTLTEMHNIYILCNKIILFCLILQALSEKLPQVSIFNIFYNWVYIVKFANIYEL